MINLATQRQDQKLDLVASDSEGQLIHGLFKLRREQVVFQVFFSHLAIGQVINESLSYFLVFKKFLKSIVSDNFA
jgi:hypothetical protein